MTVDGIAVKSELQLRWDVPCCDDGQASVLAPMYHVVVKDKWRHGAEVSEKSGRSRGRGLNW